MNKQKKKKVKVSRATYKPHIVLWIMVLLTSADGVKIKKKQENANDVFF